MYYVISRNPPISSLPKKKVRRTIVEEKIHWNYRTFFICCIHFAEPFKKLKIITNFPDRKMSRTFTLPWIFIFGLKMLQLIEIERGHFLLTFSKSSAIKVIFIFHVIVSFRVFAIIYNSISKIKLHNNETRAVKIGSEIIVPIVFIFVSDMNFNWKQKLSTLYFIVHEMKLHSPAIFDLTIFHARFFAEIARVKENTKKFYNCALQSRRNQI